MVVFLRKLLMSPIKIVVARLCRVYILNILYNTRRYSPRKVPVLLAYRTLRERGSKLRIASSFFAFE